MKTITLTGNSERLTAFLKMSKLYFKRHGIKVTEKEEKTPAKKTPAKKANKKTKK